MRRMILPLMLLAVAVAVGSCESGSTLVWDGAVRDSAGIQVVENFGTPLWKEGEGWEFTEVLRIGVADGAPEYEFGEITGLAVLSDRRVVVADALGHHLRFFSPEGIYERSVGTAGSGPGEFGSGRLRLHQGPGDTLVVWDQGNRQGHTFAPDGAWLGSFSTLPRNGYNNPRMLDNPQTGSLVSQALPRAEASDPRSIALLRDVHGAILDTVARVGGPERFTEQGDVTLTHYYRVIDLTLCCGVLVTRHSDESRLLWYELDGTLTRIVSLARELLEMTGEDQSVLIQQLEHQWRGSSPERVARGKSRIRFESNYPPYRYLRGGPAATLLAQQVRPFRDLDADERSRLVVDLWLLPLGSSRWDVFDREGRYLGAAVLPGSDARGLSLIRFVQDLTNGAWYMYSVWRDEDEVDYVVAWRIDGPMPG